MFIGATQVTVTKLKESSDTFIYVQNTYDLVRQYTDVIIILFSHRFCVVFYQYCKVYNDNILYKLSKSFHIKGVKMSITISYRHHTFSLRPHSCYRNVILRISVHLITIETGKVKDARCINVLLVCKIIIFHIICAYFSFSDYFLSHKTGRFRNIKLNMTII